MKERGMGFNSCWVRRPSCSIHQQIADFAVYRARKNGLQNMVKKDPSRSGQTSLATAGINFTKPCTKKCSQLCTNLTVQLCLSLSIYERAGEHAACIDIRFISPIYSPLPLSAFVSPFLPGDTFTLSLFHPEIWSPFLSSRRSTYYAGRAQV